MIILACPVCSSNKLKVVHYCAPIMADPDMWTWGNQGYFPKYSFQRIECCNCGATTQELASSGDAAIENWNRYVNNNRNILMRVKEDPINPCYVVVEIQETIREVGSI